MMYLFMLLHLLTGGTLEDKILKLRPEASAKTAKAIADAVREFAPLSGFSSMEDQKLILAVIMRESAFIQPRTAGESGEWGVMQVIPADGHIRRIALDYRCNAEEQAMPSFRVISPSGQETWHKICKGANPNIMAGGNVWPWKISLLLKHSMRAGVFIGIREMAFWKKKYEDGLKARYWDTQRLIPSYLHPWHTKVKDGLGAQVWVVHYNYGGKIKTSNVAKSYPLMLMKYLKAMED